MIRVDPARAMPTAHHSADHISITTNPPETPRAHSRHGEKTFCLIARNACFDILIICECAISSCIRPMSAGFELRQRLPTHGDTNIRRRVRWRVIDAISNKRDLLSG